jgi:hypothetical protein
LPTLQKLKDAKTLDDLAAVLGYKPSALAYIVYKLPPPLKYRKFKIPKRGGGEREICAPLDQLKTLQRHVANALYACRAEIDGASRRPMPTLPA